MIEPEKAARGIALVIGGSISGLLAARALSSTFDRVVVLERDNLPLTQTGLGEGASRKGTPQAKQTHVLLERGRRALEKQLPGLTEALIARGGALIEDVSANVRWRYGQGYHKPGHAGFSSLALSRPLLETTIRERVLSLPNVRLLAACNVRDILWEEDANGAKRAGGVHVVHHDRRSEQVTMAADLVVDAGGRGSRSPKWLEAAGFQRPEVENLSINMGYVTGFFRRPKDDRREIQGALVIAAPPGKRLAVLLPQDGDRWALTIGGYLGDHAPADADGFLQVARALGAPEITARVAEAEAVGAPVAYTFAASRWRRYDRLPDYPAGYVVMGDALCSFNPVYGQGMTVAALEAAALETCVQQGRAEALAARFYTRANEIIDDCWQMVRINDLGFKGVVGHRTASVRFFNWYMERLHHAAQRDAAVSIAFLRVLHMLDAPRAVVRPGILWRVLGGRP
jgi:2-polyprenyl-6-methoxyphenol hydroxylase-like FAD-dependent oxidoreductase